MEGSFRRSVESDPYSLSIIEELFRSKTEWNNTNEVVKMSIKALFDSIRLQGQAIKEIQNTIPLKANKSEVNSELTQKANITDISRTIAEIVSNIETRVTVDEVRNALKDKLSYKELQEILQDKLKVDEIKIELDKKVNYNLYSTKLKDIEWKLDNIKKDMEMKSIMHASVKDVEDIRIELQRKANIADVNVTLQQKAGKEGVANALKRKANAADMEIALDYKVDKKEMERMLKFLNEKTDMKKFNELQRSVELIKESMKERVTVSEMGTALSNNTAEANDRIKKSHSEIEKLGMFMQNITEELKKLIKEKASISDLEAVRELVDKKADIKNTGKELIEVKTTANDNLKQTNKRIDIMINNFEELKKVIGKNIEDNYADMNRLKQQILSCSEDTNKLMDRTNLYVNEKTGSKGELVMLKKSITDIRTRVDEIERYKMDKRDLEEKNEAMEVQKSIKKLQTEVNEKFEGIEIKVDKQLENIKGNVEDVKTELIKQVNKKASSKDIEEIAIKVSKLKEELPYTKDKESIVSKQLESKTNIDSLMKLLDTKANTQDVEMKVEEIKGEVMRKGKELEQALADQALINETLCAENCVARWLWKSGALKNGYSIPWESQSINTCPENFLWEKGRTFIVAVAPGLHEIALGFFSSKNPEIELLVNGEAILSIGKTRSKSSIRGKVK